MMYRFIAVLILSAASISSAMAQNCGCDEILAFGIRDTIQKDTNYQSSYRISQMSSRAEQTNAGASLSVPGQFSGSYSEAAMKVATDQSASQSDVEDAVRSLQLTTNGKIADNWLMCKKTCDANLSYDYTVNSDPIPDKLAINIRRMDQHSIQLIGIDPGEGTECSIVGNQSIPVQVPRENDLTVSCRRTIARTYDDRGNLESTSAPAISGFIYTDATNGTIPFYVGPVETKIRSAEFQLLEAEIDSIVERFSNRDFSTHSLEGLSTPATLKIEGQKWCAISRVNWNRGVTNSTKECWVEKQGDDWILTSRAEDGSQKVNCSAICETFP